LYGAEKVGNIQYVLSMIIPSGSAYHPGKRGLPEVLVASSDEIFGEQEIENKMKAMNT
jgi:hypothetical protein